MSKARNLADLLEADGDVKSDNLDNATSTVDGATDTNITSVADNDLLAYDSTSSKWINQSASEAGIVSEVVGDTTPQLGGVLDTNGNNIEFPDSSGEEVNRLKFGAGDDLQIYHDGSNSYVSDTGTGNLIIEGAHFVIQTPNDEKILQGLNNGAVSLYYDGAKKFDTTSTGIDVTGEVQGDSLDIDGAADISGDLTLHANLDMQDDDRIKLGTGDDLQIYHDGSNSYIADNGTGNLNILADNNVNILNNAGTETKAQFVTDGAVNLYYDNAQKLATTSSGVSITGDLTVSGSAPVPTTHTAVGTYAMLMYWPETQLAVGSTTSGSNLRYFTNVNVMFEFREGSNNDATVNHYQFNFSSGDVSPSGTWRNVSVGRVRSGYSGSDRKAVGLFVRVS